MFPARIFPTAAIINGASGIYNAYTTGRGKIYLRARCHFEDIGDSSRQAIIATELPYQVNKARLLEKIAELVKEGKLEGISGLRDESDKDGMRMVIELRRGEVAGGGVKQPVQADAIPDRVRHQYGCTAGWPSALYEPSGDYQRFY